MDSSPDLSPFLLDLDLDLRKICNQVHFRVSLCTFALLFLKFNIVLVLVLEAIVDMDLTWTWMMLDLIQVWNHATETMCLCVCKLTR